MRQLAEYCTPGDVISFLGAENFTTAPFQPLRLGGAIVARPSLSGKRYQIFLEQLYNAPLHCREDFSSETENLEVHVTEALSDLRLPFEGYINAQTVNAQTASTQCERIISALRYPEPGCSQQLAK